MDNLFHEKWPEFFEPLADFTINGAHHGCADDPMMEGSHHFVASGTQDFKVPGDRLGRTDRIRRKEAGSGALSIGVHHSPD